MRIGTDFDNTIVCYDAVFYQAALEKGLIPSNISPSKGEIRDYLRKIGKEEEWTKLQGYIYGARMDLAAPYEGVETFFHRMIPPHFLCIISHRTKYPYLGSFYDLHLAAKNWLQGQPFFFPELPAFFLPTLPEKLQKIGEMECDLFIDDLPEVLLDARFPTHTKKVLFDPNHIFENRSEYHKVSSWQEFSDYLCRIS